MLDVFSATPFLGLVVVVAALWLLTRRYPGLPPGPPLLPFVGNALSNGSDPKLTFRNLRSRYGDIFSVYLFNKPVIVLNGFTVLKDALVKNADVFSDRPYTLLNDFISRGKGIIGTSGDVWREQRRFTLNTLRDFGMGKNIMEDKINEEISQFLAAIDEKMGQGFDCSRLVHNAVSNVICSTVFGKRFEYTDSLFVKFLKALEENLVLLGGSSVVNALPLVRFLPGDPFKFKKIVNNASLVETLLTQPSMKEHLKTHDDNDVEDFLGAYIKEMRHRQQQNEDTSMDFENLNRVIANLFVAGTETTATSIRWALVYFLNYPDVQEKCFQEILENVGQSRRPSMKDKTNLPYVEATITEVLRHSNIVPANLPHTVPHDVQFRGYTFPKGILVIPNLDSVLRDNDVWGDADNFRPERFLNDEGKFQKKEEFIAFSLGRRVCLGEAMARMELFLFLTTMIQRFQFVSVNGQKPSMDGHLGLIHNPKPFAVRAVPRE
ncbi:LOW QUALITY PROTEIN: cytochrome P450 2U1-like [Haliotis rubra]|uniref:LOW QUALITY PROTEIN: cytochrome P450 2U1-like n=1 Tax=Haliotis rubra TaxID=36100 RepID=UPI001EE57382|nr:LOW QUALITY PROTEIN: cytochrome P450 2U1-like [Haliotis rubra]